MSGMTIDAEPVALVDDQERVARAALTRLSEPGDLQLSRMVVEHGAVATYAAIRAGELPDGLSSRALEDLRSRLPDCEPERDLDRVTRLGGRLICPGDSEWPGRLDDLAHAPPAQGRGGPPLALWVRGAGGLGTTVARSVSVVGARMASEYGIYVASEIGTRLAQRQVTVVSGAAYGIDAAAHRGCLAADGTSVAVLACGVDVDYPRAHRDLLDHVTGNGLIVSEHPPGVAPHRFRFLIRNRLIAALTLGTVVVEAAVRSGALNTAGWALGCQRELMAVPGSVMSAASAGVHQLLRDGAATLVTDGDEVIEQVGQLGVDLAPARVGETRPRDELPLRDQRVLDAVPVLRAQGIARIASTAGVVVDDVLAALGALEIAGYVEPDGSGWRLSARERARRRHVA